MAAAPAIAEEPPAAREASIPPGAVCRLGTLSWRLPSPGAKLAWSADGRTLIARASQRSALVLDAATGVEIARLGALSKANAAAISADSSMAALAGKGGTVLLVDVRTRKRTRSLPARDTEYESICFTPDGSGLAGGMQDGTLVLWDLTGAGGPRVVRVGQDPVWRVEVQGKGERLIACTRGGVYGVSRAGGEVEPLVSFQGASTAAMEPEGSEIALAKGDRVGIFALKGGALRREISVPGGEVRALAWSGDGGPIATAGTDARIRLWKAADGKEQASFSTGPGAATALAFNPQGTVLGSVGDCLVVRRWEVGTGRPFDTQGHEAGVLACAWSPDGTRIASGGADATIRFWDAGTGAPAAVVAFDASVLSLAWHPDGKSLAAGLQSGEVVICEPGKHEPLQRWTSSRAAVGALAWVRSDEIAWAGSDGEIRRRVLTDEVDGETRRIDGVVLSLALSRDGTDLAAGTSRGRVLLFPATGTDEPIVMSDGTAAVTCLAWGPKDEWLIAGSLDLRLRTWERGGKLRTVFHGMNGEVSGVAVSPDGTLVAHSNWANSIQLNEVASRKERGSFAGDGGRANAVAWSPDGKRLAGAWSNSTLLVIEVPSGR
jgi:WD40 repeat protein